MMVTTSRRPPADAEAVERIIAAFRSSYREIRCIGGERMLRNGISMTQHHILSLLDRHGEMSMSHLAEMLDVSVSNATGLVDRMEERGLLERVRITDDRRVVHVHLTEAGRTLLADVEVLKDDLVRRILAELDREQLERIELALDDLRGAVAAVVEGDPAVLAHAHRPHDHRPNGDRPTR
jgi:DNA-binding MarR family transcriptional regulator